jgi:hypothetical protein
MAARLLFLSCIVAETHWGFFGVLKPAEERTWPQELIVSMMLLLLALECVMTFIYERAPLKNKTN